jgi:hypothetical protein
MREAERASNAPRSTRREFLENLLFGMAEISISQVPVIPLTPESRIGLLGAGIATTATTITGLSKPIESGAMIGVVVAAMWKRND